MVKLDETRLADLHTAGELLDAKYGKEGTESRAEFDMKSRAYYYNFMLRDKRKDLKIIQIEMAAKSDTDRS